MNGALRDDLKSLVVLAPTWLGDTVMATPALTVIRAARPGARITVFHEPGLRGLLDGHPAVDAAVAVRGKGFGGPFRTARAIRRLRAEAVLLLPNSVRSALAARLSGAAVRIGRGRDGRSALLTHTLRTARPTLPVPTTEDYAALAELAVGVRPDDLAPTLAVTAAENTAADAALAGVSGPFALLIPGASKPEKRWPAAGFGRVADALAARGITPVFSGSPAERAVVAEACAAAGDAAVDLTGHALGLGGLKAVVQRAVLIITNDTGPRHLAAALGTPMVSLFGPTDHRWTRLEGVREHRLLAEPFLPEDLVADRHARLCAIERIAASDVIAAVEGMLDARDTASNRAGLS